MSQTLDRFIGDAHAVIAQQEDAAGRVTMIAPLMRRLLDPDRSFLQPDHFRSNSAHYERNAIHISLEGNLSLFALVWLPGQWTPVHDHGSWGWSASSRDCSRSGPSWRSTVRSRGIPAFACAEAGWSCLIPARSRVLCRTPIISI